MELDKGNTVSSNQYFNLAGWLRDVRSVLTDNNDRAASMYAQLIDLLEECLNDEQLNPADGDASGTGDDVADASELESEDAEPQLDVPRSRIGGRTGPQRGELASRRMRGLGGSARLGDPLPHPLSEAELRREGQRAGLARAVHGPVTSSSTSVPRGTKKGGKRHGKKS